MSRVTARCWAALSIFVWSAVGGACAQINEASPPDGEAGTSDSGLHPSSDAPPPTHDAVMIDTARCGDGTLDPGEQCDDGNVSSGDGCSAICQLEDGWACPTPGRPCQRTSMCGDGVLEGSEQCDDGNASSGDGCSSTCTVENGYVCRVSNRPCSALCGDGVVRLDKQCDDGNTNSGDGCSGTCTVEPGWSCSGSPSVCMQSICGNGQLEAGEACDCGSDPTNIPSGCTGPNGLFNGDGTGCSNTCTTEPVCRGTSGAGSTHACSATCGNGNIEPGENCDDGNQVSGDGCSSSCQVEEGFTCSPVSKPDTVPCTQPGNTGQCLKLPIKYRDFKSEHESGGHPDFFYYGAKLATGVSVSGVTAAVGLSTCTSTFGER